MVKDFKALNLTVCLWIPPLPLSCIILLTFGLNKCNLFRINYVFLFIICLVEKFRKELHQKPYLAVLNAFLRKLNFLSFTVKILCVLSFVCLSLWDIDIFCFFCLFLCCGDVSTMSDLLYSLMYAEHFFPPKTGIKKALVMVQVGSNCPKIELEIVKNGFVDTFLFIILLIFIRLFFPFKNDWVFVVGYNHEIVLIFSSICFISEN